MVIKGFISKRIAANGLVIISSLACIFHFLVLGGIIPFEIVWGGRLRTSSDMISFEAISIGINLLFLAVACIHSGFLKLKVNPTIVKLTTWLMLVLFMLNTVGNVFSDNQLEKIIFTPITFLSAMFCLRLVFPK